MTLKTVSLCAAFLAATASPLFANRGLCADREQVLERLQSKFGENRQSIGLGTNNRVMELFASTETGSWTITITTANGTTCLIASGQAFEKTPDEQLSSADSDV